MTMQVELADDERELLVELLHCEEASLSIQHAMPHPSEYLRELYVRGKIVRRLLARLAPDGPTGQDRQSIASYY